MEVSREHSRAFKNSIYSIILNLITVLGSFFIGSIIARFLGPNIYGSYASAVGLWVLFSLVSSGPQSSVSYFIAKFDVKKYKNWIVRRMILFVILLSFLSSLIFLLISPFISKIYFIDRITIYSLLLGIPIFSVQSVLKGVLVGAGKLKENMYSGLIFELLRVIQIIFIILIAEKLFASILGYVVAYLLSLLPLLFWSKEYLKGESEKPTNTSEIIKVTVNSYYSSIIGFIPSTALVSILLGSLYIQYAGFYRASTIISNLLGALGGGISTGAFSTLVYLYNRNEISKISSIQLLLSKYLAFVIIPIFMIVLFFTKQIIIILFKAQFLPITNIVLLLSTAVLISQLLSVYNVTGVVGRYDLSAQASFIGIIAFFSTLPFIKVFGATGGAISVSSYTLISLLVLLYYSNKYVKLKIPVKQIFISTLLSFVMIGFLYGLYYLGFSGFRFIIAVFISLGFYFLLAVLTKQFSIAELKKLISRGINVEYSN
ncbi:MAG: lipopolysaccharide biosynthesis protein [Candidatus Rehaiarchaeum fermentans]|nr:lipopolysaccharide biosynthesis protein [Candidatus Rehaiarchaeum fermentans]